MAAARAAAAAPRRRAVQAAMEQNAHACVHPRDPSMLATGNPRYLSGGSNRVGSGRRSRSDGFSADALRRTAPSPSRQTSPRTSASESNLLRENAHEFLPFPDSYRVEGRHIAQQRLSVERGKMPARDKVSAEPQLAATPGQCRELGGPISEDHREPRQPGA